jgi:hypothetical protein
MLLYFTCRCAFQVGEIIKPYIRYDFVRFGFQCKWHLYHGVAFLIHLSCIRLECFLSLALKCHLFGFMCPLA